MKLIKFEKITFVLLILFLLFEVTRMVLAHYGINIIKI